MNKKDNIITLHFQLSEQEQFLDVKNHVYQSITATIIRTGIDSFVSLRDYLKTQ